MVFKRDRDRRLWVFLNENLKWNVEELVSYAEKKYGVNLVITDTIRTFEEQKQLNAEILAKNPNYHPTYPSPHNFGNAVDLGHIDDEGKLIPSNILRELADWYNSSFPYDHGRVKSCIFHKGTAAHLHCQINSRAYGNGVNPNDADANRKLIVAIRGHKSPSVDS